MWIKDGKGDLYNADKLFSIVKDKEGNIWGLGAYDSLLHKRETILLGTYDKKTGASVNMAMERIEGNLNIMEMLWNRKK